MPLLRTFGSAALLDDAGEQLLPKGKPLALLAYCAADRRRALSRDECAALLWSDMPAERARHSVRQVIWRLRKLLGDDFGTRDDLVTGVGPGVRTDREQFLAAAHAGDADAALALYRGPYLDGVVLPGGDEFDDWLQFERHRLEESLIQVVERAVERALEQERRAEARELADRLLERAPAHPGARRLIIECALAMGDLARARQDADALETQAQLDGSVLTARVLQTIARTRQSSAAAPADAAPSVTLDFVGRDGPFSEIVQGWQQAQNGKARLFFVTGAAGIGKSRLLQVVHRRCASRPSRSVLVRANAGEQHVAFGFASLLVRALGALPGAMGVSEASARELVALDPSLTASLKVNAASWDAAESPRRRALALLDLLQAVAEQQPLALLLDDWHWVDTPSRELLTVALGRCDAVPLMVIVSSRHAQELPALAAAQRLSLTPLTLEDSLEALRSTGVWPALPAASQFLVMLATASRGMPLDLYERLTMAVETRQLRWHDGEWQADAWESLSKDVAAASPLARRLAACSEDERLTLLLLSTAGTPVTGKVLRDAWRHVHAPAISDEALRAAVAVLDSKGLTRSDGSDVMLAHDTIADAVHENTAHGARTQAHAALAVALESAGTAMEVAVPALRHALLAGDTARAGRLLSRVIVAARQRGDTRGARVLLHDVMGTMPSGLDVRAVLRGVPVWQRWGRPSAFSLGLAASVVAVVALVAAWRIAAAPSLRVLQMPATMYGAISYGPDVYRLAPTMIVETDGPPDDSVTVRVRSLDPNVEVVAGAEVRAPRGAISLASLRVRATGPSAALQIEADGHRAVQIVVRTTLAESYSSYITASLLEGTFGSRHIDAQHDTLRVGPSEHVQGVVQIRYSSVLTAASVWASMTPSWGDPEQQGRELAPLLTPTIGDVRDLPVQFVAPSSPGRYQLIFVVAAEPSGGYTLSGTNWTVERPIWTDGNELASLSDSVLTMANRDGYALLPFAFPEGALRRSGECIASPRALPGTKLCYNALGLFAVTVLVEGDTVRRTP